MEFNPEYFAVLFVACYTSLSVARLHSLIGSIYFSQFAFLLYFMLILFFIFERVHVIYDMGFRHAILETLMLPLSSQDAR